MSNGIRIIRRIVVYDYVRPRKRPKGQRLDKLAGAFCHAHADDAAGALQSAQDFGRLIGRDSTADTQRYFFFVGRAVQGSLGAGVTYMKLKINVTLLKRGRNGVW